MQPDEWDALTEYNNNEEYSYLGTTFTHFDFRLLPCSMSGQSLGAGPAGPVHASYTYDYNFNVTL